MMGPAPVARLVRDPRRFGLDQQLVHLEAGTSVRHPFHQTPCRLGALLVRLQSRMVVGRQKVRFRPCAAVWQRRLDGLTNRIARL